MILRPYSRSCRTASIRSGIAGGLAGELECHLSWRSGTYARSTTSGTTRRLDRQRSLLFALHHRDHARALAGQTQLVGHRIELGLP